MMKAFYITNSFSHTGGGLVGAVSGLVRGVDSLGIETTVSAYQESEISDLWSELSLRPLTSRKILGLHFGGGLEYQLADFQPDIVHAHGLWLRTSQINEKWCSNSKTPYVISPHGMLDPWAVQNSGWKKKIAGMWFEYEHMSKAACFHALCASEAESIRKFGLENPICIVPNGIDLPADLDSRANPPWKQSKGRKALLFIGRLHPKKGLPLLLSAWAELKRNEPNFGDSWFLAIAGWSEVGHREELEQQVSELELTNDVEFLGSLHGEAKAAALNAAEAFVLPSYSEGLPMSILEAWSYKLPVIMTPECNLPEGFQTEAALRCETSILDVLSSLRTLYDMSDEDRLSMGVNGHKLVQDRFVWKRIAEQMSRVYEWVLGESDVPECVQF